MKLQIRIVVSRNGVSGSFAGGLRGPHDPHPPPQPPGRTKGGADRLVERQNDGFQMGQSKSALRI